MMKEKQKPNIYEYHDYRNYLEDVIQFLSFKKVSLRKLAKEMNTTAANLSMIRRGDRGLSENLCESLGNFLGLITAQVSYLKSMVTLMDDKDLERKHQAYKKMKRHYKYQKHHGESLDSYKYLSDWVNVVIREMSQLEDFEFSFNYLRSKLPKKVSGPRIKKSMAFLEESGYLKAPDEELPLLECAGGVYKLSLSKFHGDMMQLNAESIYDNTSLERMIMGHTIALDDEGFKEGVEIIEEAIKKLQGLSKKKKSGKQKVYHFTLAGIPLTK